MGDNQQLLNLLSLPNVLLDPTKQKEAVTLLCQLINTDSDEPCIVQPSIKLLSSHQPLTRIVVMQLVQRHVTRNPDIMPQATNALLKCAVDPNPAVRRAAVSTLACVPGTAEVALPVVAAALRDPHPSVQRAAAVACRILPRTNPHNDLDHVDQLYRLIRSEDPLLLHACLTSLEALLAQEGGVVVSRAMVKHLANRSRELPDMALAEVLRLFPRYTPSSDSERLTLMNRLDWLLASPQPHLVQAALRVFFHLCTGALAHLRADAVARAAAALCGPGHQGGVPELRQLTLETVQQLGRQHYPAFCPHYRYFLPRPSDGDALSERLLSFLPHLAGPEQAPDIVRELSARLAAPRLQAAAARALVRLGRRRPELAAAVADPLARLCRVGGAAAVAGALTAADLAPLPAAARAQLVSAPLEQLPAPARLLPLVGRWGAELEPAAARLRQAAARYGTLDDAARAALLEATARLMAKRPVELQVTLGRLLELSWRSGGELRRLAARLYAVLATDQAQSRVEECSATLSGDDHEGFHTVGIDPAALDAAQQSTGRRVRAERWVKLTVGSWNGQKD